jgi:hypothetical protein
MAESRDSSVIVRARSTRGYGRRDHIVGDLKANNHSQLLSTDASIGYLIMDLDHDMANDVRLAISALPTSIRTRILF